MVEDAEGVLLIEADCKAGEPEIVVAGTVRGAFAGTGPAAEILFFSVSGSCLALLLHSLQAQ